MKYKVVDHWSYNGFNVVTEARFVRKGFTLMNGWKQEQVDVVRVKTTIYNPLAKKLNEYEDGNVYAHDRGTKKKWYHKWEYENISIAQAFDEKLKQVYEDNIHHVKSLSDDQQMTDGLPDSLKNLQANQLK